MSKIFDSIEVSEDIRRFVDHSFDVVDQIFEILEKQGKTQRDLANLLGKKESEVSKWMQGTHNFTIKSIAKIEAVLGETIITTPCKATKNYSKTTMIPVQVYANPNRPLKGEVFHANTGWDRVRNAEIFKNGVKSA